MVQGLVAYGLAVSMALAARNPAGFGLLDAAGITVLAAAIIGEAVADAQLRRFKSDPANRGRVCDAGLWAWSRHPNYFFEWLGWVAYPLFALSGGRSWGLDRALRPGADVLDAAPCLRRAAARSPYAPALRRRLPRLCRPRARVLPRPPSAEEPT